MERDESEVEHRGNRKFNKIEREKLEISKEINKEKDGRVEEEKVDKDLE